MILKLSSEQLSPVLLIKMLIETLRLWEDYFQENRKTIIYEFFIVVSLLLGSGVFSHILSPEYLLEGGRLQIAFPARVLLTASYVIAGSLICLSWRELLNRLSVVCYLWGAVLLVSIISVVYNQLNPFAGVKLLGFLGCSFVGIMLFVCPQNFRRSVELIFWVCAGIVFINVYYLLFYSSLNIANPDIKGVFIQKNQLGHFSFLAVFVSSFIIICWNRFYRWLAVIVLCLACWLLFLSKSITSNFLIIIAIISCGSSFAIWRFRFGWLVVSAFIPLAASGIFFYWPDLFALVGKSPDFTERTAIWMDYWGLIQQKIIFGYGYGAYPDNPTRLLRMGTHSGYVQLLYFWGVAGVGLIFSILVFACKGWWLAVRKRGNLLELCFCGSFLVVFLALNITETYMLNRSGLIWPLLVYCSLQLDAFSYSSLKNQVSFQKYCSQSSR